MSDQLDMQAKHVAANIQIERVSMLAQKLDEARDNRRGEYDMRIQDVAQERKRCAWIVERAGVRYGWPLRTISECVAQIREGKQP